MLVLILTPGLVVGVLVIRGLMGSSLFDQMPVPYGPQPTEDQKQQWVKIRGRMLRRWTTASHAALAIGLVAMTVAVVILAVT